jgi:chromosome segregation ATPase
MIDRKVDILIHLHAEIADRINTARSIRSELMARHHSFVGEVQTALNHLKNTSYSAVVLNHRIRNNLALIQMIEGYCDVLDERIAAYQHGLARLQYFINRSEDELKMYRALGRLDLDELLTDVDQVITECQAEIKIDLIELDKIDVRSCENIWQDIVAGQL